MNGLKGKAEKNAEIERYDVMCKHMITVYKKHVRVYVYVCVCVCVCVCVHMPNAHLFLLVICGVFPEDQLHSPSKPLLRSISHFVSICLSLYFGPCPLSLLLYPRRASLPPLLALFHARSLSLVLARARALTQTPKYTNYYTHAQRSSTVCCGCVKLKKQQRI